MNAASIPNRVQCHETWNTFNIAFPGVLPYGSSYITLVKAPSNSNDSWLQSMRVSTISHVWTRTIIHYHQPRLAQWKWLPDCHGPFKNNKAIIWTNIRTTVTLKARKREKRRKLKKLEWLQNYPALLMPVANRYEHINPARSSGHLMKRSGHRNFNAVTTTASGLWCCFWIAHCTWGTS